ncbi:DUF2155 domain-containing protein [Hyphomicrobium facile]|uniref:DUF2155 domain-containing protein n=1 Tax=Hyphomicrobium facile TaxID=51670 RepID=A0A1I7NF91_9HYPH|nr:hypothetical protein SAMN04488557_1935 [Hyphomicrobium facile]
MLLNFALSVRLNRRGAALTSLTLLLAGAMTVATAPAKADRIENQVAVFSALDKVTAHISKFEVALGETATFGALKITPRACYSRPPTEEPKTTTFVEIDETQLDGSEKRIFTGWMFAESPGIYGLEHPTYDVWLTECNKPARTIVEQKPVPPEAAPADAPATAEGQQPPDGGYQDNGEAPVDQDYRRRVRR